MQHSTLTKRKEIALHLFFWLIWFYFSFFSKTHNFNFIEQLSQADLLSITWQLVFIATFYFNYVIVLPRVFKPFRWKKLFLGFVTVYFFFVFFRFIIEQHVTVWLFNTINYPADTGTLYYLYDNFFFSILPIIVSTVFWLIVVVVRMLEYNSLIIEEQKNTEIKFLKAQINPHFIFNTLNNIYSMVYFKSEASLQAIEQLSNIMRFTTYESQKEKIKLKDEIEYIQSFIALEMLRHEEKDGVLFTVKVTDATIAIPPYLLSPLVENALKHGVISKESPIQMTLICTSKELWFTTQNTIGHHQKDHSGGIGLENLKKRLAFYYPTQHECTFTTEDTLFTANLKIRWETQV